MSYPRQKAGKLLEGRWGLGDGKTAGDKKNRPRCLSPLSPGCLLLMLLHVGVQVIEYCCYLVEGNFALGVEATVGAALHDAQS